MPTSQAFSGGHIVENVIGWYPSTLPLATPYADGLLVTGGAARLVRADGGAGILFAAQSGRLAAETCAASRGNTTSAALSSYRDRLTPVYAELEHCYRARRKNELRAP
jgi:flavin-dependent dehydrogenase